jgi:hypothetical protein
LKKIIFIYVFVEADLGKSVRINDKSPSKPAPTDLAYFFQAFSSLVIASIWVLVKYVRAKMARMVTPPLTKSVWYVLAEDSVGLTGTSITFSEAVAGRFRF